MSAQNERNASNFSSSFLRAYQISSLGQTGSSWLVKGSCGSGGCIYYDKCNSTYSCTTEIKLHMCFIDKLPSLWAEWPRWVVQLEGWECEWLLFPARKRGSSERRTDHTEKGNDQIKTMHKANKGQAIDKWSLITRERSKRDEAKL